MEHVVDGGQADVLVDAAVAGDEVRVQQFVVVFGVAIAGVARPIVDVAVGDLADRHGLVGDVGEEGVAVRMVAGRGRRSGRLGGGIASENDVVGLCWECRPAADAGDRAAASRSAPGMKLP